MKRVYSLQFLYELQTSPLPQDTPPASLPIELCPAVVLEDADLPMSFSPDDILTLSASPIVTLDLGPDLSSLTTNALFVPLLSIGSPDSL